MAWSKPCDGGSVAVSSAQPCGMKASRKGRLSSLDWRSPLEKSTLPTDPAGRQAESHAAVVLPSSILAHALQKGDPQRQQDPTRESLSFFDS